MLLALLLGYLTGSIPFSFIIAKAVKGIDLRRTGSGNVGSSNLVRSVGLFYGIIGGLLDALKAPAVPLILKACGFPASYQYVSGLAAVVGHNWPIFLRFKGGRGVASTLGLLLFLAPREFLVLILSMGLGYIIKEAALGTFIGFTTILPIAIFTGEPKERLYFFVLLYLIFLVRRISFVVEDLRKGTELRKALINRILFDSGEKVKLKRPL